MHWFHHPHIELLARYPSGLLLQSDELLDPDENVETVVEGITLDLSLQDVQPIADSDRPWQEALQALRQRNHLPQRKYVYRGELRKPKAALPHLYVLLEPAPVAPLEERDHPRFDHRLKARSAELPGFEGTVYDISLSGMRLDLHAPVQRGRQFRLELDLDHASALPMDITVEVRWVRQAGRDYEAGVRFVELSPEHQRQLAGFLDSLGRSEASLSIDRS